MNTTFTFTSWILTSSRQVRLARSYSARVKNLLAAICVLSINLPLFAQTTPFTTINWTTAASQPFPVSEAQGKVVNGKLYSFGGFDSQKSPNFTPTSRAYVYNPGANTWAAIAPMPAMNGTGRGGVTHAGFATDGTDIYFAGGYTSNAAGTGQIFGTREAWKYIVSENRYERIADLPIVISAGQLEYLDGKLYHIGGTNEARTFDYARVYRLDLSNQAAGWVQLKAFPNPRQHMGSAAYGGKIYIFGGQNGHDSNLITQDDVHRYDPATNAWTQMADLPTPSGTNGRGHISSSAIVVDNRIVVLAGETIHNSGRTNLVSAYDPATNSWQNLTSMPQSRYSGVAAYLNGTLYYTGGSTSSITYKGTPVQTSVPADACIPISTLPCANLQVNLPFNLTFDAAIANTISDKNTAGTGFTVVDTYTGTRLAQDGTPSNSSIPGYEPSKLTLSAGRLQVVSSKGIAYQAENNQLNSLGVRVDSRGKLQIETTIVNPFYGTSSEQGGIWFGLDEKTFVKLVATGNKVQLRREINDVSSAVSGETNPDQRITPIISGLNNTNLRLRLIIDPVTNTAEGFYSTNGINYINAGESFSVKSLSISGMGITASTAYAGILATHRNGSTSVTYSFDNFSVTELAPPVQSVQVNFQPSTSTTPSGYVADTGLPYDAGRGFGWISPSTLQPVDLTANMRERTGSGDIRLRTVVQMQSNTSGQNLGTWEYAITNGFYKVDVSVGDPSFFDSNHRINAEGTTVVSNFIPTSTNKHRFSSATVEVTDGKLTLDASGGTNTKLNYVIITKTTPVDNKPPTVSLNLSGTQQSAWTYSDEVQVAVQAADEGGSGIATTQYSLNNAAYATYNAPFKINAPGNYTIRAKAVDGSGNETATGTSNFSIVKTRATNAYMVLENLDKFPANDRLTFSLIQIPWRRTSPSVTPYNSNHSKVKLRINNKGTSTLVINNLNFSRITAWKIAALNGAPFDTTTYLPINIAPRSSAELTIEFIGKDLSTRVRNLNDTLYISSNDDSNPNKKVILHAIWQKQGEGGNEPYASQIIAAFGFKTNTGFTSNDGTNDGSARVANSDEILSSFFVRADASKPVSVIQLAAYHGCCSSTETFRWYNKSTTATGTTLFTHNALDGQSLLPRRQGSSTTIAQGTFNPSGAFGLAYQRMYTDRTRNDGGKIGIRIWKAKDVNGNIIPNAYILGGDYLGSSFTNYDYQDNIYYISNVKPENGAAGYSELLANLSAVSFNPASTGSINPLTIVLNNTGRVYPDGTQDPAILISSVQIVGPNANEFSFVQPSSGQINAQGIKNLTVRFSPATRGIKNAALLVNYNSSLSPLRIPLYGIANDDQFTIDLQKRIKSASDNNVTIAGNVWEADNTYRKGSVKLDTQVVPGGIAGTDDDVLYQTYLSSTADFNEIRYEVPIANGNYQVRLHFVENFWSAAGARVFNISIENQLQLSNFDIFGEVGYRTALVKDFQTTVADGVLIIRFNPSANRLAIAGLEIYKPTAVVSAQQTDSATAPGVQPQEPVTDTSSVPGVEPEEPITQPEEPITAPEEPVTAPEEPITAPEVPVTEPDSSSAPIVDPVDPITDDGDSTDAGTAPEVPIFDADPDALPELITDREITDQLKDLQVYPNPNTGNEINISINNFGVLESVTISLQDITGRIVQSQILITDEQGSAIARLPAMNGNSPGIYIIRASALSGSASTKLMVQ